MRDQGSRADFVTPSRHGRRAMGALMLALLLAPVAPAWPQTLQNPRRLTQGPGGHLLVSDRGGSVVAVDKDSLEPVWSFALPEEGAPFGLAAWRRLLFVGNTETQNVEVYRMLGPPTNVRLRFEYNLGFMPPGQPGPFAKPISIGVDSSERLVFVLDGATKAIRIFDLKGRFERSFQPADDEGVVLSPVSLAVDEARREVLVGDFGDPSGFFRPRTAARILIYDYEGRLLFRIDGNGSTHETARFVRVQGIATTPDGRIFAADPLGSRILVLDRESGALLAEFGAEGSEPGQLMLPLDVHLDESNGDLFVSNNRGARRVEVFRNAGS